MNHKHSLCMIIRKNEYNNIVKNITFSDKFYIKHIVFPDDRPFQVYKDSIYYSSIDRVYYCIDESEILFIPTYCGIEVSQIYNVIEYALTKDRKIICSSKYHSIVTEMANQLRKEHLVYPDEYVGSNNLYLYKETPIILISSVSEHIDKFHFILALKKKLELDFSLKVTILSNHENGILWDIIRIPEIFSQNNCDENEKIDRFRKSMLDIQTRCSSDIIIIDHPGGIRNPYNPDDINSEMLLLYLLRAVEVDYSLHVIPLNFLENNSINFHKDLLKTYVGLDVDEFILSDTIFDVASLVHKGKKNNILEADFNEAINIIKSICKKNCNYLRMDDNSTINVIAENIISFLPIKKGYVVYE